MTKVIRPSADMTVLQAATPPAGPERRRRSLVAMGIIFAAALGAAVFVVVKRSEIPAGENSPGVPVPTRTESSAAAVTAPAASVSPAPIHITRTAAPLAQEPAEESASPEAETSESALVPARKAGRFSLPRPLCRILETYAQGGLD